MNIEHPTSNTRAGEGRVRADRPRYLLPTADSPLPTAYLVTGKREHSRRGADRPVGAVAGGEDRRSGVMQADRSR